MEYRKPKSFQVGDGLIEVTEKESMVRLREIFKKD